MLTWRTQRQSLRYEDVIKHSMLTWRTQRQSLRYEDVIKPIELWTLKGVLHKVFVQLFFLRPHLTFCKEIQGFYKLCTTIYLFFENETGFHGYLKCQRRVTTWFDYVLLVTLFCHIPYHRPILPFYIISTPSFSLPAALDSTLYSKTLFAKFASSCFSFHILFQLIYVFWFLSVVYDYWRWVYYLA